MTAFKSRREVIIIGAGAGGLWLNFRLAEAGIDVMLMDRQNRAGRKLLISGGGKCNVTNLSVSCSNYIGDNPDFCGHALARTAPRDVLNFLDGHGISWEERELGQIFLRRGAEELRDLLLRLGERHGSVPLLGREVLAVRRTAEGFELKTSSGIFLASKLVLATGSPAWPSCGADASGLALARSLGHALVPPRPALTPLAMPKDWPLKDLAGISAVVGISIQKAGAKSYTLPLMLTHRGISGPAALQVSSWRNAGDAVVIDWLPGDNCEAMFEGPGAGRVLVANLLSRKLPPRLVRALVPDSLGGRKTAELSRKDRNNISESVHRYELLPLEPDFSKAEACRGGVDTAEICPHNMESRLVPGLFVVGEVMDVCGELGGYNLHWAWASAEAALLGCLGGGQYR